MIDDGTAGAAAAWAPGPLRLSEDDSSFRAVFEFNPQPMFVLDLVSFRYLAVNDAALALYGYSRAEFLSMRQSDLRVEENGERLRGVRLALAAGRKKHFEDAQHRTKSGAILDVEIDVASVAFGDAPATIVVVTDVTERVRLEEKLQYQAFHDELTGLPNRALFNDRVEHALARSVREGRLLAVLFLDLDNFKTINDGLGHAAGDELLQTVALRLHEQLRAEDTAARFGGDEFAVLLESLTEPSQVARVCERIASALGAGCHIHGTMVSVQVSIGVSYGTEATTSEEVLRNADVAMYGAKANGKACFQVYEPAMHQRVAQRLQTESDLRSALEDGSLQLHYQPLFEMPSLRVVGVEALLRWAHPVRGMIPPLDFIPLAEDTGLILPLGRWVLDEACAQLRRWQEQISGLDDLNVAVNLSPRQLEDPAIVGDIQHALSTSGIRPEKLVLEITESILMRDVVTAATRLAELSALGVKIAIDDFGTGQSSLSQLRRFPVHILKVDKSLVDPVGHDPIARDMLNAVVGLGKAIGLDVVAEGVETIEQANVIRGLGNLYVQGFLFSRPECVESMTAYLTAHSTQPGRQVSESTPDSEPAPASTPAADGAALVKRSAAELMQ